MFWEGGDKNSKGWAAIVVFVILALTLIWSFAAPKLCDPF